jgi:hypothetical protein
MSDAYYLIRTISDSSIDDQLKIITHAIVKYRPPPGELILEEFVGISAAIALQLA